MKLVEKYSLRGKVAIITGGAGLLGIKHAEAVAEAGGIPILWDINDKDAIEKASIIQKKFKTPAKGMKVDITDLASVKKGLEQVLSFIRREINEIDALIIEDYGKGVITPRLLAEIVPLAKKHKKIITVDPKVSHFPYYQGVTCITPNEKEAQGGSGIDIQNDEDINRAGKKLLKDLNLEAALITLGENGMRLFEKSGPITHIPTVAQEVFDVSGAGDTVIAAFTLALASGATKQEAAYISNFAAGIVVSKVGTAVATKEELLGRIDKK